jgi:hypothetical protein
MGADEEGNEGRAFLGTRSCSVEKASLLTALNRGRNAHPEH